MAKYKVAIITFKRYHIITTYMYMYKEKRSQKETAAEYRFRKTIPDDCDIVQGYKMISEKL